MSLATFLRRQTAFTVKVFFAPIYGTKLAIEKAVREREIARTLYAFSPASFDNQTVRITTSNLAPQARLAPQRNDLRDVKLTVRGNAFATAKANSHVIAA